jgi:hypothetical protein
VTTSSLKIVAIGLFAAGIVAGCGSGAPAKEKPLGSVTMALTTSNGTTTYKLRNATFDIAGPQSSSVTPAAGDQFFKVELPAGDYTITLRDGWSMQSSIAGGTFVNVNAVLDGPATQSFSIFDQEITNVKYSFRAGDDVMQFGDGQLVVGIGVNDGSDGACAVAPSSCGTATVTCASHIATIGNTCAFSSGAGETSITCHGTSATIPSGFGGDPDGYGTAARHLADLQGRLLAYFESHGSFPVATAAATPSATCCGAGGVFQCPAKPAAWHGVQAWDLLGFSIDTAHTFVYSYTGITGDSATVVATGDLDCDTISIGFTLSCSATNGDPSCTLSLPVPCPGSDYE